MFVVICLKILICIISPVLGGESRLGFNMAIDELRVRHAAVACVDFRIVFGQSANKIWIKTIAVLRAVVDFSGMLIVDGIDELGRLDDISGFSHSTGVRAIDISKAVCCQVAFNAACGVDVSHDGVTAFEGARRGGIVAVADCKIQSRRIAFIDFFIADIFVKQDSPVVPRAADRGAASREGGADVAFVVRRIHGSGKTDLLQIADAGDAFCFFTGLGQGGQQHGGQNRDDRDDDQKFNQGEVFVFHFCSINNFIIKRKAINPSDNLFQINRIEILVDIDGAFVFHVAVMEQRIVLVAVAHLDHTLATRSIKIDIPIWVGSHIWP